MPDSGRGFHVEDLKHFEVVPSSLGIEDSSVLLGLTDYS
jgi:hypothetical protein